MRRLPFQGFAFCLAFIFFTAAHSLEGQTATYHLHQEASTTSGLFQLKTAGPDTATLAIAGANLSGKAVAEYLVKEFDTQASVPNVVGTIASGSTLSFQLWMRKTGNFGTMFPRAKLRLNNTTGTLLCTATGTTALTTTLTKYTITCATTAAITMARTDRLYLWVGVNLTVASSSGTFAGELDVEGTLNGSADSQVVAAVPPPATLSVSSLSFANQAVNTTSAAQTVVLNNNQTTALAISGVAVSGDYAQTNNCGTSLAVGASCTVNVTFGPTAGGARTGTLTITDAATNSPQTVALSGTGITLTSISVTPASPSIFKGKTQQFKATGTYSDSSTRDLTASATWISSAVAVATINSAGLATGVNNGTSTITATSGTISGSTVLTVTIPALTSIAVTPATPSIPKGLQQQFTATGTFADGSTQNLTSSVTWSSSTTSVATITSAGLATCLKQGTTSIKAVSGSINGKTTLTVLAPSLASLAVTTYPGVSLPVGAQQRFSATGTYTDGSMQDLTSVATWSSSTAAVATIDATGLATGVAQGSTNISAVSGGISASIPLMVSAPVVSSIVVSPANAYIRSNGSQQFSALGTYTDGSTRDVTNLATWSSSWTAVLTVTNSGLATGVSAGSVSVQASINSGGSPWGSAGGSANVVVGLPQVVQVQPANGSLDVPLNGRVVIRFSQPVSQYAFGTIALLQGSSSVAGGLALAPDGLSLTFTPTGTLTASVPYTVVVQDTLGSQPAPLFQSTFTTGSATDLVPPQVLHTSPQDGDVDVPINAPILVQFSKPVDPATITSQTFGLVDSAFNPVPGMLQIDATGLTASFVPNVPLLVMGHYRGAVSAGIKDTSGNSLPSIGFSFTTAFTTDHQGPRWLGSSPANGATAVPINAVLVMEFDKPLDAVSLNNGFQVQTAGEQVSGGVAFSDGDRRLTFTPQGGWAANTTYTVTITPRLLDLAVVPLVNPGSFTFATGSDPDTSGLQVLSASPASDAGGVPINSLVQLRFNKPINPLTATSETFQITPRSIGLPIAGTVTVSSDGLTATFRPSAPLAPMTNYVISPPIGITDLEGQGLQYNFLSYFSTGLATATSGPTVVMVTPLNGMGGVPLNPQVMVKMSAALSLGSVGAGAITVSAGGVSVAGTISLSGDRTTITFLPSGSLTAGTTYAVTAGGFTDLAGNVAAAFTSSFTTSASGVLDTTSPSLLSSNPAHGATRVDINSNIVLTFNEPINPLSASQGTIQVSVNGSSGSLAGSYVLDPTGTILTFTPQSSLPARTTITMTGSIVSAGGNQGGLFQISFTTGSGGDATPLVATVVPGDGTTGIGLNATVTLTFSKSLDASTINGNNFALLANGNRLACGISTSADSRVVALSAGTLPAGAVVTVVATSGVKDLYGNSLANMESQFTTANALDGDHPTVVGQRPLGMGVPLNTGVVLYLSEPMNPATVAGALHIAQNGVVVNGSVQVTQNGQVVQFTPAAPWKPNASVGIYLDTTAQDVDGVNILNYYGGFSTFLPSDPHSTPQEISFSPSNSLNIPTNAVIQIGFNEPLDRDLFSVFCSPSDYDVISLVGNGTVLQLASSTGAVRANSAFSCDIRYGSYSYFNPRFSTGSGPDTVSPTVLSVSPANGLVNVADNARIRMTFSKSINLASVNASTVQLSGAGGQMLPYWINFSQDYRTVSLTPYAPLPDSTLLTLRISGVQDQSGNIVPPQTTQFTTGVAPDLVQPTIMSVSPYPGATNVPLNSVIQIQMSKPIDPGTANSATVILKDSWLLLKVTGSYSVSPDGQTITFVPDAPLDPGATYTLSISNITDVAGNVLIPSADTTFTAGLTVDTSTPQVLGVSPANGTTGVALNAKMAIQFSKPVSAATLGQVTLSGPSGAVNVSLALSNGNQALTVIPVNTLLADTVYTLSIAGIRDLSGNGPVAPITTSFTTGSVADVVGPVVVAINPASQAYGVPVNAVVQIRFNKRMNPGTISAASFNLNPYYYYHPATGVFSLSADGLTATFKPSIPLDPYTYYYCSSSGGMADMEGQALNNFSFLFTTGGQVASAATILAVSPANGMAGVPVNPQVVLQMSAPISEPTVDSNTIAVSANGTSIPGNVSVSGDKTLLTFTPASLLLRGTAYTVVAGGFYDQAGNPVAPFTSTFTTGGSGVGNTVSPAVLGVSPLNGATGVAVGSKIALTFSEPMNPLSITENTMPVMLNGSSVVVAGNYSVDATGRVVTFTPASPLPANSLIQVQVGASVLDLSGIASSAFSSSFTTGAATDLTSPVIVSVTPRGGATGVSPKAPVVLTFSKALNNSSVNSGNFGILANGNMIGYSISISADSRVVTLTPGALPAGTVVTVVATSGITDMSGNALANFESQFTTADISTIDPATVVTQKPAYSATYTPLNANVILYMSKRMNPATVPGALHILQNGVLTSGNVQVTGNGQVIQFTPAVPWKNNQTVTVRLETTAQDEEGNSASSYEGSFSTVPDYSTVAPLMVNRSPGFGAVGVGTNAAIDMQVDEPLNPDTVNATTVPMYEIATDGTQTLVASTVSLVSGGTVIHVAPNTLLKANTAYMVQFVTGILGTNGLALSPTQSAAMFTTGAGTDTVAPTIISVSPPDGSQNMGDNVRISVRFSRPMNLLTLNASTIQISGGGVVVAADDISFGGSSDNYQSVFVAPVAPLPDSTSMTLVITGAKDIAGNQVAPQTIHFMTGLGPDVVRPSMLNATPVPNATTVPVNAVIQFQVSEPLDPITLTNDSVWVREWNSGQPVTGRFSLSGDGRTIRFVPDALLTPGTTYYARASVTDLAGNADLGISTNFTTGATADSNGPQVVGVSPGNGLVGVPINTQIVIQFSEPVYSASVSQVTLTSAGRIVSTNSLLSNGNQLLTLVPKTPLIPGTAYTVTIAGLQDQSGNLLTAPVTSSFTTGGVDLTVPAVVGITPLPSATEVPTDAVLQLRFNKRMNPVTVTAATWAVLSTGTNRFVAGAITLSADGQTATFVPSSPLDPSTTFYTYMTGSMADSEGQSVQGSGFNQAFTTGSGPAATPTVAWVNPAAAFSGATVTISGSFFGASQGTSAVTFNRVATTPLSWSDTEITISIPAGATSGNIVLTINGVATIGVPFTVLATPNITGISAASGTVGTPITITGTNFGSDQDSRVVLFNGAPATPTSWSSSSIVVPVPNTATSGPITVVVNSIGSNANFLFTTINPVITSLTPPSGGIGGTVIVNGSGFGANPQVQFNGVAATVVSASEGSVTVLVPANAITGPVTLTTGAVASNGVPFTVASPSITYLVPSAGGPGTLVAINGSGFGAAQSNSTVSFNGVEAAISSWSDAQIVAIVSDGTTNGPMSVTVAGVTLQGPSFAVDFTAELTDSLGHVTSYRSILANGLWQNAEVQGPGCSTCSVRGEHHNTFDSAGNLISETDALGHTATYTYDADSNLTSESVQIDASTTATTFYTYNDLGQVLTETDPLGNVTTNNYDAQGNLISVSSPAPKSGVAPSITKFAYDPKGQLKQITDPLQNTTKVTYTSAGLIESVTDPQNNTTSYEYDARGNRISVTDALHNKTVFSYDDGNRLTGIIYPDTTGTSFTYDYRGRRTGATDQNGKTTSYAYDDADRLVSVTDAAQNVTQYTYDTEGNPLSITDANGHSTVFGYDAFGRVVQTTFPSLLTEGYSYDAIGNLTSKTDRKGQTIGYIYDGVNRLTHKGYPDDTGVDYIYDLVGKIQRVNDPTGSYGFAYDNIGRLIGTSTQYAFLPGKTFTNTYSYDAGSNRKTLTTAGGSTNTYVYDSLSRLTDLTSSWAGHFGFGYDSLSRSTQVTRPNGVNTAYQYDSLSRLLSVLHQSGAGILDGASYTTDAVGNRTSRQNQLTGVGEIYLYDALYQLTQVAQGGNTIESYTFDNVGNRLSSRGVSPYQYNNSNQILSVPGISYLYDNNGNTVTKADTSGTTTYTWDFENHLDRVALPSSGGIVSFQYDPFGRRIQKSSVGRTTNFVYDGASITAELDSAGNVVAQYAQSGAIDQPLAMSRDGVTSFYHTDGLGSITSLTDSTGALASSYGYDAFGNSTASTGTITNPFRYTARDFDSETGLYYYRARYLDTKLGRFLSEDGLRFQAGINFYPYVSNNPISFIDPSGYKPCFVDVRCWPIEKFHLGALGYKHCFMTVRDKDCKLHDISGGPDGNNKLYEWDTAPAPHPDAVTYNHSLVPCTMVDCMIHTVPKVVALNLNYHPHGGPNSNTGAATILSHCGLADLISFFPSGAVAATPLPLPSP